jgi:hypothetical protein
MDAPNERQAVAGAMRAHLRAIETTYTDGQGVTLSPPVTLDLLLTLRRAVAVLA